MKEKNIVWRIIKDIMISTGIYKTYYKLWYCNKRIFTLKNLFLDTNKLIEVKIETIFRCNRKCSFCPMSYDDQKFGRMSTNLFKKIIRDLKDMNYSGRVVLNNYGEPLLDKRLPMFVDIVHKELKGSKIWFFTNGDLLTPEKAKIFFKKGVDLIIVSQHDKKPSPQISLLKSFDWNGKMKFVDVTETSHLLTNRGGLVDIETLHPMYCPIGCLIIRYDGTVVFCCNDYYNEVTFGNVKNKSVKEIWNNPRYREIRKNVLKRGKFDFDICKKCLGIT